MSTNSSTIKRVALYGRVSKRDGQDSENQLAQLRQFCQSSGCQIVHEYVDNVTGKHSDRAQFKAAFAAASRREFDAIVTWALDRLSREGVAQTFEHIKTLLSYGVAYVSYTEPHFRTTGPAGELMIAVAAWVAQQERIRISERVRAGLERARVTGTRTGRQIGRPVVVFDRAQVVELGAAGRSWRETAAVLAIRVRTARRVYAQGVAKPLDRETGISGAITRVAGA